LKPAFIINNRNKGPHVFKAVAGALSQTYTCEIIISDQGSTDNSMSEIRRALDTCPRGADHDVRVLSCPVDGPSCMATGNLHFDWCVQQTDAEWILQCSADDFSLPDRVRLCMEAVAENPCSAVATTMFFAKPGQDVFGGEPVGWSGYPTDSGYVPAGAGIERLAYGSVIAGYSREFLLKVGHAGPNTIDVLYGYLAALDKGFYVVANPQHVHVQHAGADNMGFGGKLLAAEGDEALRLAELNHAQLFRLYQACAAFAERLHPEGLKNDDYYAVLNTMLGQSQAWLAAREVLSANGITPGALI
jgi:glycosyltransferase involved in cell wall biosynthesis